MKKRIVSIMALSLVGTMMAGSLTGCGLQTKATDIVVDDGDTIIVDQEDMETEETEPETEAEPDVETQPESDEITSSEVIGSETEEPGDFAGAENESIVLYSEKGSHDYIALDESEYELHSGTVDAIQDVPIYNSEGYNVGYIKAGSTVAVAEFGQIAWTRFENPIAEADYDYLYVMRDYVTDGNAISSAEAEDAIKEELAKRDFDAPVYTEVTDDMEMYEFRIKSVYTDDVTDVPTSEVNKYFTQRDQSGDFIRFYKTYAIVCTEDTDGYIICQVYYKDKITDEEWEISAFGR